MAYNLSCHNHCGCLFDQILLALALLFHHPIAYDGMRLPCSPRDAAKRGGMVVVDVPHAAAVVSELDRRDVLVDFRPGAGIRISPHFYTTDGELDVTINEIKNILETKAYEKHLASDARF